MNLRKVFQGVLVGTMVVSMSALYAYAEDTNTSTDDYYGVCGDNLIYEITQIEGKDTYRVTISGEGAMYDYDNDSNEAPWQFLQHHYMMRMIEEVVVEEGVTSVGSFAFYNSIAPEGNPYPVNLPDSLTEIGDFAFYGINSEETFNISIPKNVETIGAGAFATGMTTDSNLGAFEVDEENAYFCAEDGVLYSKDLSTLVAYPRSRKDYKIKEGTKYIGDWAFCGMYNSESQQVILPEGLLGIGDRAFNGNMNIDDVLLPGTLKTIGTCAFANCSLNKVFIPESVEGIGWGAFTSNANPIIYGGEVAKQYADEDVYCEYKSVDYEEKFIPVYTRNSYYTGDPTTDETREISFDFSDVTENSDIKSKIENLTGDAQCYVYDIKMLCNGEVFQPYTAVSIYIRLKETVSTDHLHLYRQEDDGSLSELDYRIVGNFLVFQTDHFSLYVIANDEVNNENTGEDQEKNSEIPNDTTEEKPTQDEIEYVQDQETIVETVEVSDNKETINSTDTKETTNETVDTANQQERNEDDNSADTGDENWPVFYAAIVTTMVIGMLAFRRKKQL